MLGKEVLMLRVAQGGFGPGVEHDHLVLYVEVGQVLGDRDMDTPGMVPVVVDGCDSAGGQRYRRADLSAQIRGPGQRSKSRRAAM